MSTLPTIHRVTARHDLSHGAYIIEFERNGFQFTPGEHILLGIKGDIERREYSIYSSQHAEHLAILAKEVAGGSVSTRLRTAPIGSELVIEGRFGYFTLDPQHLDRPHVFIATGTGIAPYHCFITSYEKINHTLIHGTRYLDERYGLADFTGSNLVHCCSSEQGSDFHGRVTAYLRTQTLDAGAHYFLCGNCDMIYEVFDILKQAEVPPENIFAEVYF